MAASPGSRRRLALDIRAATRLFQLLGLLLLLLTAQQGAVVHALSHVHASQRAAILEVSHGDDAACALCPAFAQASTPAFSHAFQLIAFDSTPLQSLWVRPAAAAELPIPQARSRGPPDPS